MNDPGLDVSIDKAQQDEEADYDQLDGTAEEQERERELLDKSRWWFASTACPLIAGTFGPLANAFNICAIGAYWREDVSTGELIKDPSWLVGINSVSLVCGFFANLALLFNMAGRAPFYFAQPVTIVGFFAASFLLIGLVSWCGRNTFREQPKEIVLSQAYFYGAYAGGIYFIIASLNCLTVWGAIRGKYDKKFHLTTSQRTLMLQTISFMGYLLVGGAVFQELEGWKFLDAVYWANYTLLTIGIGPLYPKTHAARSLMMPYAIGGVFAVGLIIGSIRSLILESGKTKMQARGTEKKRRELFEKNHASRLFKSSPGQFSSSDGNNGEATPDEKRPVGTDQRPNGESLSGKLPSDNTQQRSKSQSESEREYRKREFEAMRYIQRHAYLKNKYGSLAASTAATAILWLVGAVVFKYIEHDQGWSYFISIYFAFTQLTTIGYGDYSPMSNLGKVTYVLYVLMAVPTLTILISDLGDTVIKAVSKATNYIGSLTILPSDRTVWSGLKNSFAQLKKNGWQQFYSIDKYDSDRTDDGRHGTVSEILIQRLTEEERKSWTANQGAAEKDREFYKWILGKEVGKLIEDKSLAPPKKYTYDEWAYYLKLLGQDEENPKHHGTPQKDPSRQNKRPEVGKIMESDETVRPWSWLGIRSPLLSHKEETDWILDHMTSRLVRDLGPSGIHPVSSETPVTIAYLTENCSAAAT